MNRINVTLSAVLMDSRPIRDSFWPFWPFESSLRCTLTSRAALPRDAFLLYATGLYVLAMVDPRGSVRAAGPPGCVLHPEAARRVSPDAFLRGASIAWAHLQPEERKAIRATCRNGRQLHDRLITDLRITLGPDQREGQAQQHQPSPLELRVLLGAVVWRGARLQSLRVWFRSPIDGRRQAQL